MTDQPTTNRIRIRRLTRVQLWCMYAAMGLWLACAVINVVASNWAAAVASLGAGVMTWSALAANRARDIAIVITWDQQDLAAAVRRGRDQGTTDGRRK